MTMKISCPLCFYDNFNFDLLDKIVTYMGNKEDPKRMECADCKMPFYVIEEVERTFKTALLRDELLTTDKPYLDKGMEL